MLFCSRIKEHITGSNSTQVVIAGWLVFIAIGFIKSNPFFLHRPPTSDIGVFYLISGVTIGFGAKSLYVACQPDNPDSVLRGGDWFALGLTLVGIGIYYACFALAFT